MNKKFMSMGVTVVALGIVGYLGGTVYAATNAEDSHRAPLAASTTYEKDLPPFTRLGNGGTVGGWRLDTPLEDRPDYVGTRVNGKTGYLKVSDINDGFVPPKSVDGEPVDVTDELAAAERRQREVMIQPNAKGEIWAPVYDSDGVTVIGKKLMNPDSDSEAP